MNAGHRPTVSQLVRDRPHLASLAASVLDYWPEHESFLARSLDAHDDASLATVEEAAAQVIRLIGDDLPACVEHYKWLCEVFNEEALHFLRTGGYRCKTFAEAEATVYANADFMKKYMDGLLVSQPLWYNHARAFVAFRRRFLPTLIPNAEYLEIGPGHGLFLAQAAAEPGIASVTAWDVSAESLRQTAQALSRLGVARAVSLAQRDVMAGAGGETFDAIVISEVLEHLEEPHRALRALAGGLRAGGRIFVNVPINSPAPDHIFLLRSIDEAAGLVRSAGLTILDSAAEPMSGYSLAKAVSVGATITCLFVAERAS